MDAANERQRRRMAQKLAELEADDEDSSDRRKRKSGRVGVARVVLCHVL